LIGRLWNLPSLAQAGVTGRWTNWGEVSAILLSGRSCSINEVLPTLPHDGGSCLRLSRESLPVVAGPPTVVPGRLPLMLSFPSMLSHRGFAGPVWLDGAWRWRQRGRASGRRLCQRGRQQPLLYGGSSVVGLFWRKLLLQRGGREPCAGSEALRVWIGWRFLVPKSLVCNGLPGRSICSLPAQSPRRIQRGSCATMLRRLPR
jgi:hypothetical protein